MSWASNTRSAKRGKALALLLTVLAHLAVLASVGRHGAVGESAPRPGSSMLLVAVLPVQASPPVLSDAAALQPRQATAPVALAAPEVLAEPLPEPPLVPRFFQLHELTEQPSVASGLARGRWLVLPGAAGGRVTVRFWINDMGDVLRVQLIHSEAEADEEEAAAMLEALRQLRFHPGHMGRIAVHSEVQMDLRVVSEVGF